MAKGFGGMNQIMQQAQKMQKKMAKMQEELGVKEVTGSAGGNMINVIVNGKQEVLSIKIDPSIIKEGDQEMIQDLVTAAVNDGLNRSREMVSEAMGSITGGLNIPGMF
jgi:hypothetical protein